MDKVISYLKEVGLEMTKVVWPERKDVIKLTLIVFIISGIIGAYIGILDLAFTQLFERLLSI